MKLGEVKAIAKQRGIDPGRMRKDELIKAYNVLRVTTTVLEARTGQTG